MTDRRSNDGPAVRWKRLGPSWGEVVDSAWYGAVDDFYAAFGSVLLRLARPCTVMLPR